MLRSLGSGGTDPNIYGATVVRQAGGHVLVQYSLASMAMAAQGGGDGGGGDGGGDGGGGDGGGDGGAPGALHAPSQSTMYSTYTRLPSYAFTFTAGDAVVTNVYVPSGLGRSGMYLAHSK